MGDSSSLWKFRPMDNIPTIMHYELCITNYELTKRRTSVRLYEGLIHQMRGFSQQLCITHYEL
jgi:hypothetical protein